MKVHVITETSLQVPPLYNPCYFTVYNIFIDSSNVFLTFHCRARGEFLSSLFLFGNVKKIKQFIRRNDLNKSALKICLHVRI